MRKLHVKHGGQGGAEHRNELGRVSAVMRVHKVHRCQLKEAAQCWRNWSGLSRRQRDECVCMTYALRLKLVIHVSDSHPEIPLGQLGKYILYRVLMGVEFHLARTVKQEITVSVLF